MKIDSMNGMAGSHHTNLSRDRVLPSRLTIVDDIRAIRFLRVRKHSLERIHPQTLVHARRVGEEGGERGFKDESEVERPVAHSLVHDRVAARLANDQVGPLHYYDGHEESGVAGVFESLTVAVSLRGKRILLEPIIV